MPALFPTAGPNLGRELNREHPISHGCIIATHFADRSTGIIGAGAMPVQDSFNAGRIRGTIDPPVVNSAGGSLAYSSARGGRCLRNITAGDARVNYGREDSFLPTAGTFTALCYYEKTDTTDRPSGLFGLEGGTSAQRCGVHGPWEDGTVYWDFGGTSGGTTRLAWSGAPFAANEPNVFVFYVGERGMEIWMDGQLRASHTNQPTRSTSTASFRIGVQTVSTMDLVRWYTFQCWNRGLKESEIREISRDPFLLFRQPVHRVYFAPTAPPSTRNRAMVCS